MDEPLPESGPGASSEVVDLLQLAVAAAGAGAAQLTARVDEPGAVEEKGGANNLVSEADRASERAIMDRLLAARPGDAVIGEEGTRTDGAGGVRWVVDPLDGTTNYLYGLGRWSVSIAAEIRVAGAWRTVAGVVCDPSAGETFTATRGGGAWLGDRRLRVRDPVDLDRAVVATGFAYDAAARARQARTVAHLLTRIRDIRRFGSAALELCAVAAGRVDGFYEDALEVWDFGAGALVAGEAGAVVSPLRDGVLAAGPALHAALATELDAAPVTQLDGTPTQPRSA